MTPGNAAIVEDAAVFTAVLTPYRSLGPTGFVLVMSVFAAFSFTLGAIFWAIGAWPVIGFMGLDVLLVYVALRVNFRSARAAEEIKLTRDRLTVRKITASGRAVEIGFNPYWARLEVDRIPEFGVMRVRIASHGQRLDIAGFLGPRERESFAEAFGAALARARAAPER